MPPRLRCRRFAFEIAENGKSEFRMDSNERLPVTWAIEISNSHRFLSDDVRLTPQVGNGGSAAPPLTIEFLNQKKSLAAFQIQLGFRKYFGIIFFRDFAWGINCDGTARAQLQYIGEDVP